MFIRCFSQVEYFSSNLLDFVWTELLIFGSYFDYFRNIGLWRTRDYYFIWIFIYDEKRNENKKDITFILTLKRFLLLFLKINRLI